MAATLAARSSFGIILRSYKYYPTKKFKTKALNVISSRNAQFNSPAFGLCHYSNQAAETAENLKSEKDVKSEDQPVQEKELLRLIEENEKYSEKVKDLEDKYKRSLADNENIRARMRREISDAKQYGIQGFVKDLVEVADVLGKATESVPKEALAEGNVHLKSLFEGLQMTESQLLTVFKRHGVFQINPIGEKFDPNRHEALFEQEDPSKEPGSVGTVTKVGYRLHERCVRPALVGVVKGKKS